MLKLPRIHAPHFVGESEVTGDQDTRGGYELGNSALPLGISLTVTTESTLLNASPKTPNVKHELEMLDGHVLSGTTLPSDNLATFSLVRGTILIITLLLQRGERAYVSRSLRDNIFR